MSQVGSQGQYKSHNVPTDAQAEAARLREELARDQNPSEASSSMGLECTPLPPSRSSSDEDRCDQQAAGLQEQAGVPE